MQHHRIAAVLLCLALLLSAMPQPHPAMAATAATARGSCFENPLPMKLGRRATGKTSSELASAYYQISIPGYGRYKLESGGGLKVKAYLYRQNKSWVKTFVPSGGQNGDQIDCEFTISQKGDYFLVVEGLNGKTGSFTVTFSDVKDKADESTPVPTVKPTPKPTAAPTPAPQAPATEEPETQTRALAVPAIRSVAQYHAMAVKVQWSAVAGASGYGLYKSETANGTYSLVRYVTATDATSSYLTAGKQYFYKVCAYKDAAGVRDFSAYSPCKSIWILCKPDVSGFQSSPSAARLTWGKVNGAAGYTIYRAKTANGTYTAIGNTGTATFYTDAKLAVGSYYYKVAAFCMNGTAKFYGAQSATRLVTISKNWVPTPPPNATAVPPATPTPPNSSVTYRALLVGNSNYEYPVSDLNAGPDISSMSGILSGLNMSGNAYHVTSRTNLTAGGILSAISSAFAGADADDVSLFYYSGHGVADTGTFAGALVGTDISYLTTAQLRNALNCVPGTIIVLLDSCGSGAAIQSRATTQAAAEDAAETEAPAAPSTFNSAVVSAFAGFTARSAEMASGSKFKVITACSIATSTWQNAYGGFFTQGIVRSASVSGSYMRGDSDKSGVVTQQEAYVYARDYSQSVNNASGEIPAVDMQVQVYPSGSAYPFFQR